MFDWRWKSVQLLMCVCFSFVLSQALIQKSVEAQGIGKMVRVEVAVPPKAQSIRTSLSASPARPIVNQDQILTYTFSYQSSNPEPVPLTLQVYWGSGTTHGLGDEDIQGLIYQVGSATDAYGDSPPVVDASARTITWQISALPKTTEPQQVQFKLKTSDAYQGVGLVTFPIEGRVISIPGVPVAREKVGYLYTKSVPMAREENSHLQLSDVRVVAVNDTQAQITTSVNQAQAQVQLLYGSSTAELNQTALQLVQNQTHTFLLTNLTPESEIYFRVLAETSEQSVESDVFHFSTASQPTQAVLEPWSLTLAHKQRILRAGLVNQATSEEIPKIPQQSLIDVNLHLPVSPDIRQVEVLFKGPETASSNLREVAPGVFVARVELPSTLGRYDVLSRITDAFGNVAETKVEEIDITKALQVIDGRTGEPIMGASVAVYQQEPATGGFELLTDVGLLAENPILTNAQGMVALSRKPGQYRVEVTVPGYRPLQATFELDEVGSKEFPQQELETAGNYWIGRFRYRLSQQINWVWW